MFTKLLKRLRIPKYVAAVSGIGAGLGLIVILKDSFSVDMFYGDELLTGRTVIITGTTSGIGKELAMQLSKREGRIIMGCRDMEKCEEVRKEIVKMTFNNNVECKKLDLSSLKSIRDFAEDINKTEPRLDVLVNNAGVMCPPKTITEDGFELQLCVNHLGPFLLTNLLLEKLKASRPSRIVHVGTLSYTKGDIDFDDLNGTIDYNDQHSYCQSKLAQILFNDELARRLTGTDVSTYVVYPGLVKTKLNRHMGLDNSIISSFLLYPISMLLTMSTQQGVQTLLHCILSEDAAGVSGKYWVQNEVQPLESKGMDIEVARRLWHISERWTKLKPMPSKLSINSP